MSIVRHQALSTVNDGVWLLELGEHSAQFPGLERIEIEESMKGWRTVMYDGFGEIYHIS